VSSRSSHKNHHLVLAGLAAVAFVFSAIAAPSIAWTQDGLCQEQISIEFSGASMSSPSTPALTSLNSERLSTPCDETPGAERSDYNICFEATPYPHTTIPEWLAQWQAEEAVNAVFEQVNEIHAERASREQQRLTPLAFMPGRTHASMIDQVKQANSAGDSGGGGICVETSAESCNSLPPATAMISMASVVPAERAPIPPQLRPTQKKTVMQSILVDLRVGPGLEYRRRPERPPTSSLHVI
jgi:hypothetical protein